MPTTPEPPNPTYAYVGAFIDELARAGLHHVVICPGSRSTPLALTFAASPTIRCWMHVDERSAAFFALGMAKLLDQPVIRLGLLERRQVLALQIFDQRNFERLDIRELSDDDRHVVQADALRRPPTPLAGDQLKRLLLFD